MGGSSYSPVVARSAAGYAGREAFLKRPNVRRPRQLLEYHHARQDCTHWEAIFLSDRLEVRH
eukprot:9097465-Pyramimonas_sp.AAC.1